MNASRGNYLKHHNAGTYHQDPRSRSSLVNPQLKQLIIARRQKAFASGKATFIKIIRNKVNRDRKRRVYNDNKVKDLRSSKPRDWWREVKQLCGSAKSTGPATDLRPLLHPDIACEDQVALSNKINKAFVGIMQDCSPLTSLTGP